MYFSRVFRRRTKNLAEGVALELNLPRRPFPQGHQVQLATSTAEKSPGIFWGSQKNQTILTYGAVGAGPLVVADAGSRLGAEGSVIGALLGTSALEDLAADAPPARVAVALSVMTGSVAGARGVQTVHCGHTRWCQLSDATSKMLFVGGRRMTSGGPAAASCTLQRLTVTAGNFSPACFTLYYRALAIY